MKVALTILENRISPVFDCAQMLFIVDIIERKATGGRFEPFQCKTPFSRAAKLSDLRIEVLICGAVSNLFASIIENHGIIIISFITGSAEEVLDAYVMDGLCDSRFLMPGCESRHYTVLQGKNET